MADFYDDPATGRLMLCGAAGGGGSEYNGIATEIDIRQHADAYRNYQDAKNAAANRAAREAAEATEAAAVEALKSEEAAIEAKLAAHGVVDAPIDKPAP